MTEASEKLSFRDGMVLAQFRTSVHRNGFKDLGAMHATEDVHRALTRALTLLATNDLLEGPPRA